MHTPKKKPIYLGFASQKGGVGKSTLAEVLASILYYERGVSLFVIDCDDTQESFFKLRERDKAIVAESPEIASYLKGFFQKFGKPSYVIFRSNAREALALAQKQTEVLSKQGDIALVLFDFPGHASTQELLNLSIEMDYIISPIEADPQSLASSLAYAETIRDLGISLADAPIKDLWLLWNKVNRSASTAVMDYYSSYAQGEELGIFTSRIYHSVRFARELSQGGAKSVFRCSYLPPSAALRASTGIDEWVSEVIEKLNLKDEEDE